MITRRKMDEMDRYLKKTIGFKPNMDYLSPKSVTYLKDLGEYRERSKWISQACEFLYDYEHHRKGLLIRMIQANFEQTKHLLRIIGRAIKDGIN